LFVQRFINLPAVGKNADLRRALEELNAASNAASGLQTRLFSHQPAFIVGRRLENLAAFEALAEKQAGDPNFQTALAKTAQFVSQPVGSELFETLVQAQPNGTPKFVLRNRRSPMPGKGPELRALLEERVRKNVAGRIGAGLSTQVGSPDGPAFVSTSVFSSMAGFDQFRAANAEDAGQRAWATKVQAILARPAQQEILRILVPFPA
jgi:hypothetical protein